MMTAETTGSGEVGPGRGGRMSRQRKTAAVLRLLRGEDLEAVSLGRCAFTGPVPPNAEVTFAFEVTPSRLGAFRFQWRMLQEGIEWFGDFSPAVSVQVVAPV